MVKWRNLFKPWILERGQEYFDCGQVVELKENGSVVMAEVNGSQDYQVEIHRAGDCVIRMTCDCPYAEGGENCKHMAAVLLALDEKTARPGMDWKNALAQMPEQQVRELLYSLAVDDRTLQNRIVRMVSGPGDDPDRWQSDLKRIISEYTDYQGWLDYYQAYDCMLEVAGYLDECLPSLLNSEQLIDAAMLVMTVYGAAFGQDMDDSDGGLGIVSESCRRALEKVLSLTDTLQERKIFDMLHEFIEGSDWNYGSEDLEAMILSLDWSQELQQKNLEWLDENMNDWRMLQRAELMERAGASKVEMIDWWEQHRQDDGAYYPLLRLYEQEDISKAIELVCDKRNRENTPWRIANYTETLLGLLEKAGEQTKYQTELRYLVLEMKCQETEMVSRLKKITPAEQWSAVFETLLADAKDPSGRMRLYSMEGMYTELFAELMQRPSFADFQSYEENLRDWNPEQTLKLYIEILKREMDRACDRKQYHRVAAHLDRLKLYPNGQEEAMTLSAYWYDYHKNRPAMKDELKKSGYPHA